MQREPSKIQTAGKWTTTCGLPAIVLLVGDGSHHCGYVGVPKDHPLHGKDYGEDAPSELVGLLDKMQVGKRGPIDLLIHALGKNIGELPTVGILFDVHGGITFTDPNNAPDHPYPDLERNDQLWWFGYDCAHCDDKTKYNSHGVFRDLAYCMKECESLANQLWAMGEVMRLKLSVSPAT